MWYFFASSLVYVADRNKVWDGKCVLLRFSELNREKKKTSAVQFKVIRQIDEQLCE